MEFRSLSQIPSVIPVVDVTDGKTVVSRFETEEKLNNYQK